MKKTKIILPSLGIVGIAATTVAAIPTNKILKHVQSNGVSVSSMSNEWNGSEAAAVQEACFQKDAIKYFNDNADFGSVSNVANVYELKTTRYIEKDNPSSISTGNTAHPIATGTAFLSFACSFTPTDSKKIKSISLDKIVPTKVNVKNTDAALVRPTSDSSVWQTAEQYSTTFNSDIKSFDQIDNITKSTINSFVNLPENLNTCISVSISDAGGAAVSITNHFLIEHNLKLWEIWESYDNSTRIVQVWYTFSFNITFDDGTTSKVDTTCVIGALRNYSTKTSDGGFFDLYHTAERDID